jgi:hypothetical protein
MDDALETLRAAIAPDATTETRTAGANACRAILASLEPQGAIATPPAMPPIATIVAALRGRPADQLLDLAIAKLRAALPAGADMPAVMPLKFNLVPVPHRG